MRGTYSRVDVKVFGEGYKNFRTFTYRPARNETFSREVVEGLLMDIIEQLAEACPDYKFTVVPIGPTKFNIVHNCAQA